ncbi:MAG TPA: hypothetical protein PLZ36_15845, partial [Armatimonadota bacterium]|nr:hypothetical protein [Armatimonadota bacterium]
HVAEAIRPLLEGYLRVAYPSHCKPGTLLGKFLVRASNEAAANRQFISPQACAELDELRLYANQFHHDTNPAWQTQSIDPGELETFVRRTLEFVTPS